jgi:myo-inositol-1(or 4)-monophosphatase
LHAFVCDLARRSGELQISRYNRPGEVREKAPKDPVTEVDLLCEELLVSEISKHCPDDAVLSEERGGEISENGRTWLLDPLDGTANFTRGNPLFCSCVSVVEGGEVVHTAVYIPKLGELYHAARGGGAYLENASGSRTRLRVGEASRLEDAFAGADSSFGGMMDRRSEHRNAFGKLYSSCWQVRALGSAGVRGAWIAAGRLDLSTGATNTPWDYAPTALLVSEAGGRVTDLSGERWTLSADSLVATNGHLHEEVLALIEAERQRSEREPDL